MSYFSHPHVGLNLYSFISSSEYRRYFEEGWFTVWTENTIEVNGNRKYFVTNIKSERFGMT